MIEVELLPDKVRRYLNDDFETLDLNRYYRLDDPQDRPNGVRLRIPEEMEKHGRVSVTVKEEGGKIPFCERVFPEGKVDMLLYNLCPGRVYRADYSAEDGSASHERFATSPTLPRMLYVDGIRNVRDCGGWRAEGGFLREGILFRGSEMNLIGNHGIELTEQGRKTMCRELRIRTDIDLRNEEEAGHIAESPLGASVRYERKPVLGYMDLFKEEFNDTLREIFLLLAERKNYPVYLHCWAGADRTGTLVAILKAALGVSFEDITRDFEISTFSVFVLLVRCNRDFTYPEVFEYLKTAYPAPSLKARARRYLAEKVGIGDRVFDQIASILIRKEKGGAHEKNHS